MNAIHLNYSTSPIAAAKVFNELKSNTKAILPMAKRILGIRSSSIKPVKVVNMTHEVITNKSDINATGSGLAYKSEHCGGINPYTSNSLIRSFLGLRTDSYDVSTRYSTLKGNIHPIKFNIINPMSELPVSLLKNEVFFNDTARTLLDKIRNNQLINDDLSTWRDQEQKVYIPSIINRTIDKMAALKTDDSKQIKLLIESRQNIMINTLKNLGMWDKFEDRTDLMACAQSSLGHIVSQHAIMQLKISNREFNHDLSNRVYEELFNCPGEIERVRNSTQTEIEKTLAPAS